MCGIVGWITKNPQSYLEDREKFISGGLIIDTIRGQDSAGIFAVRKDKTKPKPNWVKKVGPGPSLLANEKYKKVLANNGVSDYTAMIGHNRKATYGKVDTNNAHPFHEGDITLVHNGTLTSTVDLEISINDCYNDSHCIARNLNVMDRVNLLENLHGAFALVWHDARDKTLNIIRNNERPLHMAHTTIGNTVYIASEAEMLFWLGRKLSLRLGKIVQPSSGQLLTFQHGEVIPTVQKITLGKYPIVHTPRYTLPPRLPVPYGGRKITSATLPKEDKSAPKVLVGGRRREIPASLQVRMHEHGVDPKEQMEFVPKMAQEHIMGPTNDQKRTFTVRGVVNVWKDQGFATMPGVLYGVPPRVWEEHGNHSWTVRAVGVTYLAPSDPCLVLRLKLFTGWRGPVRTPQKEKERQKKIVKKSAAKSKLAKPPAVDDAAMQELDDALGHDSNSYAENHVKGKYGAMVDKYTFDKDTRHGCVFCQGNIDIQDADFIEWVNGGSSPLCVDCTEIANAGRKELWLPCVVCEEYVMESSLTNRMCGLCYDKHLNRKEIVV